MSAWRFLQAGGIEYWAKPLANDEWALMVLYRGAEAAPVSFDWGAYHINDDLSKRMADFRHKRYAWTEVWSGRQGDTARRLEAKVPSHGVLLLRLKLKT